MEGDFSRYLITNIWLWVWRADAELIRQLSSPTIQVHSLIFPLPTPSRPFQIQYLNKMNGSLQPYSGSYLTYIDYSLFIVRRQITEDEPRTESTKSRLNRGESKGKPTPYPHLAMAHFSYVLPISPVRDPVSWLASQFYSRLPPQHVRYANLTSVPYLDEHHFFHLVKVPFIFQSSRSHTTTLLVSLSFFLHCLL